MKTVDIIKVAQWMFATAAVASSTCFAVIHYAYSNFETQRTNDVYHVQVDKRLEDIESQIQQINNKVDRLLISRQK